MDFNKITKKQLLLAALIVPILLAVIWTIRCQITSSKEYTIQTPIENCEMRKHFSSGSDRLVQLEYGFCRNIDKKGDYLVFEKDSNGYYHADRFRIIPPLSKPFITGRYSHHIDDFNVKEGQALWVQYFLNKAIREGHVVCGVRHIKNGKDSLLNIEIDGKPYSDDIVDLALNDYAEMLDSVGKSIEKGVSSYCSTAICNPDNDLNYASLLTEKIDEYIPSCLLYMICKKKDDSEFRETLTEKGKSWYKKYLQEDKYGNLQSAIQQLTSSYHWVNQENYKELYKIIYLNDGHKGTGDKKGEEPIVEKGENDLEGIEIVDEVLDKMEDEDVDTDSTYPKKIEKISELVKYQGRPDYVTISLIRFWTLRWNDGSAETIYSVLKDLNLE